jgi:Mrp family chromosome partitioning ATPase
MRRWIEQIRKGSIVDLIILDTPPALAVSDSVVLAASLKARVVMIVQANRTRQTVARRTKERFEQVGADIAGVVLNGTNPREEDYYGYDYSYYYTRPEEADSV